MSSEIIESDEEITTDAAPKAPRDDPEDEPPVRFNTRKKRTSSGGRKSASNSTSSTIINISKSSKIHIGSNIIINSPQPQQRTRKNLKTKGVNNLLENNSDVTRDDISFVSKHIDENWKDIGRILDYSEGQIAQFEINKRHLNIDEAIFKLLLDWTRVRPREATVSKLAKILLDCEQIDALNRWSEQKKREM